MMAERIACCGLDCWVCRAYIATKSNDRKLATEIAKLWSNAIEGTYTVDDIWCDGCHSNRLHGFCAKCPVRICANGRRLRNCGECTDYSCDKLDALYDLWVESSPVNAKENLERLRALD
jgi:hypothetical protein